MQNKDHPATVTAPQGGAALGQVEESLRSNRTGIVVTHFSDMCLCCGIEWGPVSERRSSRHLQESPCMRVLLQVTTP